MATSTSLELYSSFAQHSLTISSSQMESDSADSFQSKVLTVQTSSRVQMSGHNIKFRSPILAASALHVHAAFRILGSMSTLNAKRQTSKTERARGVPHHVLTVSQILVYRNVAHYGSAPEGTRGRRSPLCLEIILFSEPHRNECKQTISIWTIQRLRCGRAKAIRLSGWP